MSRATIACTALAVVATAASAQQKVPVVDLTAPSARSSGSFGAILGVRQLPGGRLLVNDAGRRQILAFDSTLTRSTVVIDSTTGAPNSYGPRGAPLIAYLGDSSLFVDNNSQSLVVIDPNAKISRVMAPPRPGDLRSLGNAASAIDNKGRLLYAAPTVISRTMNGGGVPTAPTGNGMALGGPVTPPDSTSIVRADFDTRVIDTVGRVKQSNGGRVTPSFIDGKLSVKTTINPLPTVDDWAVLSDGSVAFVRGHDYHIDWLRPDGSTASSEKLPFDWKRLTDEDKQHLIDSARTAREKSAADAKAAAAAGGPALDPLAAAAAGAASGGGGGGMQVIEMRVAGGGGAGGGASMGGAGALPPGAPMMGMDGAGGRGFTSGAITPEIEYVPLKEISDYYPAIRQGAAKADLDGNLWVLPTTSAQSKNGELVYDVVNKSGELFQRVRIPSGRSVVGFGKGGIVYLVSGDITNGFFLERTRLLGGAHANQ